MAAHHFGPRWQSAESPLESHDRAALDFVDLATIDRMCLRAEPWRGAFKTSGVRRTSKSHCSTPPNARRRVRSCQLRSMRAESSEGHVWDTSRCSFSIASGKACGAFAASDTMASTHQRAEQSLVLLPLNPPSHLPGRGCRSRRDLSRSTSRLARALVIHEYPHGLRITPYCTYSSSTYVVTSYSNKPGRVYESRYLSSVGRLSNSFKRDRGSGARELMPSASHTVLAILPSLLVHLIYLALRASSIAQILAAPAAQLANVTPCLDHGWRPWTWTYPMSVVLPSCCDRPRQPPPTHQRKPRHPSVPHRHLVMSSCLDGSLASSSGPSTPST